MQKNPPVQPEKKLAAPDPAALYLSPYMVEDGCLYMQHTSRQDMSKRKLCNFTAQITTQITRTDGIESRVYVRIKGTHCSGRELPEVEIPFSELQSFGWLHDHWGVDCMLSVGNNTRDHVRFAFQQTAVNAEQRMEYARTGWEKIDGAWEYLMPGDEKNTVTLPSKLSGYSLSKMCSDEDAAILACMLSSAIVPKEILFPLLAYTFLSPLIEFLRRAGCVPKFVVFLQGKTGSRKSTLAALVLSFFGRFTSTELPLSFRDTANSITHNAYALKDTLTCIDDFHPAGSLEEKKLADTAQAIMRSYGDRQGRGRLRADSTPMESRAPMGNAIITGEYPPDIGESGTARYLTLELREQDVDLDELSYYQEQARNGVLQNCMYGFIQFLKENFLQDAETEAKFIQTLQSVFESCRADFQRRSIHCHGRVPEMVAHLELAMKLMLMFLESRGVITNERSGQLSSEFCHLLYESARSQAERITQDKPTHLFLRKLFSLVDGGQYVILHRRDYQYRSANCLGYQDENYFYLYKDSAHKAVKKLCEDQGEHFSVSANALVKSLAEEGISERDGSKNTKKLTLGNTAPRMIWIPKRSLSTILEEVA